MDLMLNRRSIYLPLIFFELLLIGAFSNQAVSAQKENTESANAAIIRPSGNITRLDQTTNSQQERNRVPSDSGAFPTLNPRSEQENGSTAAPQLKNIVNPIVTMVTSLMIVLGLFAALVWISRKLGSKPSLKKPITDEVFEKIGSTIFNQRTQIHIIRFANRILLVSQTEGTLQTLCELRDQDEIDEVLKSMGFESSNEFANAVENFKD